ncbi:hypothetical protein C8R48DRAFT_759391 [Suillus tomentosus]|nr:hypothetical protein C8R48DRAFT_759391 [Suillus tomentosus]
MQQHRALLVPDILLVIFEHVNHEKISRWSRKSLAALASTCKAFHEPAMDLLWANMDGIEPLLGCVTRLHPIIYGGDKKHIVTVMHEFSRQLIRRPEGQPFCSQSVDPLSEHETHQFLRHAARRLVNLRCPPLDWAAWKDLSMLPTLLTVWIHGKVLHPFGSDDFNLALSLKVTNLYFSIDSAAYIIAVMHNFELPSLKRVKINVDTLHRAEGDLLLRALSQCKACQTLEYVKIFAGGLVVQELSGSLFTPIRQLFCFRQLRVLRLILPYCCSYLDNDLLFEAMSSWPHIRSLELTDLHRDLHPRSPAVTFRGLFAALRLCPHLQKLRIPIDTEHIDIDPTTESFQHTSLQSLDLDSPDVVDVEAVARTIFSMLPCIHQVNQVLGGRHCWKNWQKVNKRLETFKSSSVLGHQTIGTSSQS